MGEKTPWTFYSWILNFKGVDLPIGDLAKDIANDDDFPKHDSFGAILEYLSDKSHSDFDTLEAFTNAWSYYLVSTR